MKNTLQEYSDKLEKILCKYMDYLDEGCHMSGYDMADLIREVSGNELDARFVELYLKYVDTGRGGKILEWDITSPYNENTSKMRKFTESDASTLKDIESTYGKKTALALDKYCKLFKKNPTNVVSDLKADGNGMTEWDKFDVWARRKLKVDIMDNFDDTVDWTGAEDEKKREKEFAKAEKLAAKGKGKGKRGMKKGRFGDVYSAPTDFSTMEESTEREMDSEFIADWIVDVMHKERLGRLGLIKTEGDGSARFTLKTEDGGLFSITVNDIG